ncbi:hypothetical protein MMC21_004809 [Puttea exsequens]|nr:hypothetical protein [Puttea exsequens]
MLRDASNIYCGDVGGRKIIRETPSPSPATVYPSPDPQNPALVEWGSQAAYMRLPRDNLQGTLEVIWSWFRRDEHPASKAARGIRQEAVSDGSNPKSGEFADRRIT